MKRYDLFGWLGVVAILLAYGLVTFQVLSPQTPLYFTLNFMGSAAILGEAWVKKDYQPVLLNAVWMVIALVGLVRLIG